MKKVEAVDYLMKEYGADEKFRPFFMHSVELYMGKERSVRKTDLEKLLNLIRSQR